MGKGLDFDQLYPGRFMKAGEFQGRDVTLKIASVKVDVLEGDDKKKKPKAILAFEPTAEGRAPPKELVLCKTNGLCLKAMFGRDSGAWVGKRVTFCPELVDAFGAQELAVRVRGSPDISADITFTLKLHQKKPRDVTLRRTGGKGKPSAPAPAKAPEANAPAPDAAFLPQEPPADVLLPGQPGYSSSADEPPPPTDADAPPAGGAA